MDTTLTLVVYMALVTWLTMMTASLIRALGWPAPRMKLAFGNRENLPPPSPLAGRAQRTAKNTLENFVLFAAVALVAQAAGKSSPQLVDGAQIFFWARIVYIPVYLAGIAYVRTAVWLVSIVGLALMVRTLL
jgi:uncharacterized MAPEG superfamily protein